MLNTTDQLPGWLKPPASIVSFNLMQSLPAGPAMEIGVYRGKYLSVIRSALGPDQKLVGYDLFPRVNQQRVIVRDFKKHFADVSNMELIAADSAVLTVDRVLDDCGGKPVVISIDGSHDADPVFADMTLCEQILHPKGFIAADDFTNPYAIGVNEAVHRFFNTASDFDLAPFAFVSNKLFLCRRSEQQAMQERVEQIIAERLTNPIFKLQAKRLGNDNSCNRKLFGYTIVVCVG